MAMQEKAIKEAADRLFKAHLENCSCSPVRDLIGLDLGSAYQVQSINTKRWVDAGRRITGRKIGLTSKAVQLQLGVDQPDFGVLFADMEYNDGDEIPLDKTQQPKAEAEIAFVLSRDIDQPDVTQSELIRCIDYVAPAIEIVGSRIKNWDIKISDTIADNASSGTFVLGGPVKKIHGLDLAGMQMVMNCNGQPVSFGAGIACLGNPLNAAVWLARKCAELGAPLVAGDVILSGALGPMVPMAAGDLFEAKISGLGNVRIGISQPNNG
eukprot:GHVR01115624.1.p1 GENE.GHVR01115624.1~~GHVR01115624.1.p1  ORF type:complete len:267 (-),score=12.99 GHVR01115624.1:316-1116(-)